MAVCDEEQSFLVTMTKRGNSKVLAYLPNCLSRIEYRTSDWAPPSIV